MPLTPTSRLALAKPDPDPATGDFVNVGTLNGNADKLDAAAGAFPCTAATRPGAPWHGQIIRETDTRRVLVWNATQAVWDPVNGPFLCASGSRPASPFTNMMIRETDTRRVYIWNATQAVWDLVADPAARLPLMCRKTTEPTNLTTAFVQDLQLRVTVPATALGRYTLTGFIGWRSSVTADLKVAFTHSAAGYTGRWKCDGPSAADVTKPDLTMVFDSNILILGGTGGLTSMMIAGMANMASAGDFIFNWAQNTVDAAGNTFISLDSWFRLDPIA